MSRLLHAASGLHAAVVYASLSIPIFETLMIIRPAHSFENPKHPLLRQPPTTLDTLKATYNSIHPVHGRMTRLTLPTARIHRLCDREIVEQIKRHHTLARVLVLRLVLMPPAFESHEAHMITEGIARPIMEPTSRGYPEVERLFETRAAAFEDEWQGFGADLAADFWKAQDLAAVCCSTLGVT